MDPTRPFKHIIVTLKKGIKHVLLSKANKLEAMPPLQIQSQHSVQSTLWRITTSSIILKAFNRNRGKADHSKIIDAATAILKPAQMKWKDHQRQRHSNRNACWKSLKHSQPILSQAQSIKRAGNLQRPFSQSYLKILPIGLDPFSLILLAQPAQR
jgi:hypothetical protein